MKNQSLRSITYEAELKSSINELRENWDAYMLAFPEIAKIKKACFDAFINSGFTENQALILTDLHFKTQGDNNAK